MKNFDQQLLRLKQIVKLTADQDVASLLGMSKAAFSDRKKREAFPEDKLWALVTQHPELRIDAPYVLTGKSPKKAAAEMQANFGARLQEVRGSRTLEEFAPLMGATPEDVALIEANLRKPTQRQAQMLIESHPDKSATWLLGGKAPELDSELEQLEVILIRNYRECTKEQQETLRQQAAAFASQQANVQSSPAAPAPAKVKQKANASGPTIQIGGSVGGSAKIKPARKA